MKLTYNRSRLEIYTETRKRKVSVGTLDWKEGSNTFELTYDKKYIKNPSAIPLGPELPLSKIVHKSRGELFPSLSDRIPSRRNPAYRDYCDAVGISTDEKNPIILLGTIGKRGPSTFVFEAILEPPEDIRAVIAFAMKRYKLTYQELSLAMEINQITIQRIVTGKSKDQSNLKLIRIFLSVPEALKFQLLYSSRKLHRDSVLKFESLIRDLEGSSLTLRPPDQALEQFKF